MAKVTFYRTASVDLASLERVNGQLIFTTDTNECFVDTATARLKISDVRNVVDINNVLTPDPTKLYYDETSTKLYRRVGNSWIDLTGVRESDVLTLTNTTAYTPTQNYHPATKKYVDDNCIPYQPFPAGLDTSHTTSAFISSIRALNLPAGSTYLGGVTLTDMPFVGNAEVEIYVYPNNVIYLALRSANISPYMWECNSHTYRGWEAVGKAYADTNFLKKDNTTAYTPTGDYNPSTKKYVDDSIQTAITQVLSANY